MKNLNQILDPKKIDLDGLKSKYAPLFKKIFPQRQSVEKTLACDIGKSKIVFLELQKNPDHLFLTKLSFLKIPAQEKDVAPLLGNAFQLKQFPREGIRTALKGHGIIMRFIRFPKMKTDDLGSALKYEAEQYIPFELNDMILDYAVIEESVATDDGEKMELLLGAVKRQEIDPLIEMFKQLGCKLFCIDVAILAALNSLEYFYPEAFNSHVGVLDLGTEISTLGIVRSGKPRFIRDISYGTYDIQKRLKTRLNLSGEQLNELFEQNKEFSPEQQIVLAESLESLIGDIRVSLEYYREQLPSEKGLEKLFLTGGISLHPVILKLLNEGLRLPVVSFDLTEKIRLAPEIDPQEFKNSLPFLPVAVGLAIRDE